MLHLFEKIAFDSQFSGQVVTVLQDFYLENKYNKKIAAEIKNRLFRKLQLIDDATCDIDLRSPPSNHFEKLKGKLAGQHSIRVNKQWRQVFKLPDEYGEA